MLSRKKQILKSVHIIGAHSFLGAHVVKELNDSTAARITYNYHQQVNNALAFIFGNNFVELSRSRVCQEKKIAKKIRLILSLILATPTRLLFIKTA